jgi:hypothetical protein
MTDNMEAKTRLRSIVALSIRYFLRFELGSEMESDKNWSGKASDKGKKGWYKPFSAIYL